jgi:uridine phosphorylase
LADTVIIVGDQDRVPKVSKHFDAIDIKQQHREFVTHTGRIGKMPITVLSTGIGTDNIDIALNELDALANIDFETRTFRSDLRKLNIIRLGTCGGLQADIPVDSLVASTHGLGLDNVMNFYTTQPNEEEKEIAQAFITQTGIRTHITIPYVFEGSHSLLQKFGDDFIKGITVACPGFYGPQGRILRLALQQEGLVNQFTAFSHKHHRITNFEMETSTIYGLGKLMGHDSLSVNVVVANRVNKQYSKDGNAAVENMIEKALERLIV